MEIKQDSKHCTEVCVLTTVSKNEPSAPAVFILIQEIQYALKQSSENGWILGALDWTGM